MITVMRRYFKGRALQVVAWLTIISVVGFWGGAGFVKRSRRGHGADIAIVAINDQEISGNDYRRVVNLKEDFIRRVRAQYGQYADFILQMQGLTGDPRRLAYDSLIIDALLDTVVRRMNLTLHSDYISYKLAEPEMLQQVILSLLPGDVFEAPGVINPHALDSQLRRAGITQEEFNEMIAEVLSRDFVGNLIGAAAYVPRMAVREQFIQEYVKKKYSVLTVPFESFLKKELASDVSEEELKSFFTRESKRYMVPEKRIARVWTFAPSLYEVAIQPQEIEDYYQQHKADKYTEKPESIQVRRILFKVDELTPQQNALENAHKLRTELLKDPSLFAQKAKELSADKETASNGGLVPFFAKGSKDEQFEKAAFMMREDGEISEAITTRDGVELLQRVARKAPEYKQLKSVEAEIRKLLEVRKFHDLFMEDMRPIMETPEGSEQELIAYTEKRKIEPKTVTFEASDKNRVARVVFALPDKGINVFIDNGNGIAVQLLEIQARFLPPLEEVRAQVSADLHKERATRQFEQFMRNLCSQAASKPLADLAKQAGGTIAAIDWVSPQDNTRVDELRKKDLPVAAMLHLDKVGAVALSIQEKSGVIVRVDEIAPFDEAEFSKKEGELAERINRDDSYFFVQGFVASLYRNATIKPNKSLLDLDEELAI